MGKDRPASFYPIYGAIVISTLLSLEKQQSLSISTCRDKKRDQDHTCTLLFQRLKKFLRQLAVN